MTDCYAGGIIVRPCREIELAGWHRFPGAVAEGCHTCEDHLLIVAGLVDEYTAAGPQC